MGGSEAVVVAEVEAVVIAVVVRSPGSVLVAVRRSPRMRFQSLRRGRASTCGVAKPASLLPDTALCLPWTTKRCASSHL